MKTDWLEASSLERMHQLVAAINTLSIHAKLLLAGRADPAQPDDIDVARQHLLGFLNRFSALIRDANRSRDGAVVGADPQLAGLAANYIDLSRQATPDSPLLTIPLDQASEMVMSERDQDLVQLVPFLRELRSLIQQQPQADATELLGDS